MPFATGLRASLESRQLQVLAEFGNGENLKQVLSRHLLAVEAMAEEELLTSILLISEDGNRLSHAAAPNLPQAFCDAVDGLEIGPTAGSCGTAAYLRRPVYVSDIATDPLWADYRHLALPHDLRSCWSTPIYSVDEKVIGTFAIYRRTAGEPTKNEIEAIRLITGHVADAIMLARELFDDARVRHDRPVLRLVSNNNSPSVLLPQSVDRLLSLVTELQSKAAELDRMADGATSPQSEATLRTTAALSWELVTVVRMRIDEIARKPLA